MAAKNFSTISAKSPARLAPGTVPPRIPAARTPAAQTHDARPLTAPAALNAPAGEAVRVAFRAAFRALLARLDEKTFSCTAYDTAWMARVLDLSGAPSYPQALEWLREHQHADGSWGSDIEFFHDRILCTVSAMIALAQTANRPGARPGDRYAVYRAEKYVWERFDSLMSDPIDTVGFELLLPVLFEQARALDLDLPYEKCAPYERIRAEKLAMIPDQLIYSRKVTSTHSLEFMGSGLRHACLDDLQEENGSFGFSPAATAYVLTHCPDNPRARQYLADVLAFGCGAAMSAHPVEVFNKSWVLYNLDLAGRLADFQAEAQPHLAALRECWDDRRGVGFSRDYAVRDLDDTAVVFKLLWRSGCAVDPDVFLQYEKEGHFTCYTFERNPSVGANVHLLDALSACPIYKHLPRMVNKILHFLRSTRVNGAYWTDKWHISPYYITAHAVIALASFDHALARDAVRWMLAMQRPDGSWGHYRPTCEETAYCLQALMTYHNQVSPVDGGAVERAVAYLLNQPTPWEMPAMWIEKCLYTPPHIVESVILSALSLAEGR